MLALDLQSKQKGRPEGKAGVVVPKLVKTSSGGFVAYGRHGGPVKVPEHRVKAMGLGDKFKGLKSTHEIGETEYEMLT